MANVERSKLIENLIDRTARNPLALKSWTVTVVRALLSLAASDAHRALAVCPLRLIPLAALDTYYLALERTYRQQYDQAITDLDTEWNLRPAWSPPPTRSPP